MVCECGLDHDRMFSARPTQVLVFRQHLQLALAHGKSLFVLERDHDRDTGKVGRGLTALPLCSSPISHARQRDRRWRASSICLRASRRSRDAWKRGVCVHCFCFTGTEDQLRELVVWGFMIGVHAGRL